MPLPALSEKSSAPAKRDAHLGKAKIALVGDTLSLVRYDPQSGNVVRPIATKVSLAEREKQIFTMDKGKTYAITAVGYYHLNKWANVQIVTPPTVLVDGAEQPNPYMRMTSEGAVEYVYVRKIAIGRSPLGNWVAIDQTLYFNPELMFRRDILNAWKGWGNDAKPKDWGRLVRLDALSDEDRNNPTSFFVPYGGGLVLEVDLTHIDVATKLSDHANMILYADRRAQTMAERNALKKHPAIAAQAVELDGEGTASVWVTAWAEDEGAVQEVNELAGKIARGEQVQGVNVQPEAGEPGDEDLEGVDGDEEILEGQAREVEPDTDSAPKPQPTPPDPGLAEGESGCNVSYDEVRAQYGDLEAEQQKAAREHVGIDKITQVKNDPDLRQKLAEVVFDLAANTS